MDTIPEQLLRAELADVHRRLEEGPDNVVRESYLLGLADGLVIAASHLGITLRSTEEE